MSCSPPKFSDRPDDAPAGGFSDDAFRAMARELGADSLRYLPVNAIARAIGLSPDRLCRACVTGEYPTPTGQHLYQIDSDESFHANGAGGIRAYERVPGA